MQLRISEVFLSINNLWRCNDFKLEKVERIGSPMKLSLLLWTWQSEKANLVFTARWMSAWGEVLSVDWLCWRWRWLLWALELYLRNCPQCLSQWRCWRWIVNLHHVEQPPAKESIKMSKNTSWKAISTSNNNVYNFFIQCIPIRCIAVSKEDSSTSAINLSKCDKGHCTLWPRAVTMKLWGSLTLIVENWNHKIVRVLETHHGKLKL